MLNHMTDHRPGFAVRPPHIATIRARAARFAPGSERITPNRLVSAVMRGAPLTLPEKALLAYLVGFLNTSALDAGDAFVWPSHILICRTLDITPRHLRRMLSTLEAGGYLIREYNQANQPLRRAKFDLMPLVSQLVELEGNAGRVERLVQAERERLESAAPDHVSNGSAPEDKFVRLEQSPSELQESVLPPNGGRENAASRTKYVVRRQAGSTGPVPDSTSQPEITTDRATCFPEKARSWQTAKSGLSQTDRTALARAERAVGRVPALAKLISATDLKEGRLAALKEQGRAAVESLFPEAHRNHGRTWEWIWQRHGIVAIELLALSLADPDVHEPHKYFASFVKRAPGVDLSSNRARVEQHTKAERAAGEQPPAREIEKDKRWLEILAFLRPGEIAEQDRACWLEPLAFHGVMDGRAILSAPGRFHRDRVMNNHSGHLLQLLKRVLDGVEALEILPGRPPSDAPLH